MNLKAQTTCTPLAGQAAEPIFHTVDGARPTTSASVDFSSRLANALGKKDEAAAHSKPARRDTPKDSKGTRGPALPGTLHSKSQQAPPRHAKIEGAASNSPVDVLVTRQRHAPDQADQESESNPGSSDTDSTETSATGQPGRKPKSSSSSNAPKRSSRIEDSTPANALNQNSNACQGLQDQVNPANNRALSQPETPANPESQTGETTELAVGSPAQTNAGPITREEVNRQGPDRQASPNDTRAPGDANQDRLAAQATAPIDLRGLGLDQATGTLTSYETDEVKGLVNSIVNDSNPPPEVAPSRRHREHKGAAGAETASESSEAINDALQIEPASQALATKTAGLEGDSMQPHPTQHNSVTKLDPQAQLIDIQNTTLPTSSIKPIPIVATGVDLPSNGITSALVVMHMKRPVDQNEIADSPDKLSVEQKLDSPALSLAASLDSAHGVRQTESFKDSSIGSSSQPEPTQSPVATRILQTIQHEVANLRHLHASSLNVVLRPDIQTQIAIRLEMQDGKIQAKATCERGDFQMLNSHWPELKTSLLQQGVVLQDLREASAQTLANSNSSHRGFADSDARRKPESEPADPTLAPNPGANSRSNLTPQINRPSRTNRLLESWA